MENRQSFFNGRTLFWGFGVSLILNVSNTNFWISEIIGTILGIIILSFVKNTNTSRIPKAITGFLMAFMAGSILVNMGGTLYLKSTPTLVLTLVPIAGGFIISRSKDKSLKKTLSLLFCYSVFMSLLVMVFLLKEVKPANLMPIFHYDFKGIIYGVLIYLVAGITPILSMNQITKENRKDIIINYIMSSISIIVISLLIVAVLGNKEALIYRYPEYAVLKRIKVSEFFTNVDNIVCVPIVVDLLVTIAIGIRNVGANGKISKYIVPILLVFCVTVACSSSVIMTFVYSYFPILLISLLILTLIPKI